MPITQLPSLGSDWRVVSGPISALDVPFEALIVRVRDAQRGVVLRVSAEEEPVGPADAEDLVRWVVQVAPRPTKVRTWPMLATTGVYVVERVEATHAPSASVEEALTRPRWWRVEGDNSVWASKADADSWVRYNRMLWRVCSEMARADSEVEQAPVPLRRLVREDGKDGREIVFRLPTGERPTHLRVWTRAQVAKQVPQW